MSDRAEQEQLSSGHSGLELGPERSEKSGHESTQRQVYGRARSQRLAGETPGPGTELASYWVAGGERLLICALGKRGLEIHDVDAGFLGPSYRVDHALEDESALWAVVDDYLAQAERLGAPPMSSKAIETAMRID